MSKIRVHELAKQLDKSSKEIIETLKRANVEIQSHMSTLTEENVELVKKSFAKTDIKQEEPKKSKITQVYNPQNSRISRKDQNNLGEKRKNNNNNNSNNRNNSVNTNKNRNNSVNANDNKNNNINANNNRNNNINTNKNRNSNNVNNNRNSDSSINGNNNSNSNNNRNSSNNKTNNSSITNKQQPTNYAKTNNQDFKNAGRTNNQKQNQENKRPDERQNTGNKNSRVQNQNSGNTNRRGNITQNMTNENKHSNQNYQNNHSAGNRQNNNANSNTKNQNQGRKNVKNTNRNQVQPKPPVDVVKEEVIKTITVPESLTIKELADLIKTPAAALVKKLFLQGTMVTVNQEIDYDTAEEIALEYNCIAEPEVKVNVIEELLKEEEEDESLLASRPPVVCVMGHVDHGKTSLLDAIRHSNVTEKEAGGITQRIGASVISSNGQKITFLDTPGHEAFTAMRMRGASSTDIAILVVAADDGVMPQTVEAINHAKAAGIEIIVAINKIDKPSANIDKVKQELTEYELIPEDWGGSTVFVPVSAHTGEGIPQLLEMILLTAEISELKANPKRTARGLVIEAELDKGKGPVATVLVQKGVLRIGDPFAAGPCHGKVRAMTDDKGKRVKEAGPSTPVEILGLNDVPNAGEIFVVTGSEKEARSFAETFISEGREKLLEDTKAKLSLDDLFSQIQAGNVKELGLIIKADVQGSVEAVKQSLLKLSNEEVVVKIIHGGVGAINESDVILASASNAIIIGFNVRPDPLAKSIAEREKVDIRLYRVIYNILEDVESAMKGLLDPIYEEKVIGHAEVRQTFKASGVGTIAGSYVLDGIFQRGCSVRITRNNDLIFEGALASLKRFKDDVKEVKTGYECGLVFEKFNDLQEGDIVEAYTMVEVPR